MLRNSFNIIVGNVELIDSHETICHVLHKYSKERKIKDWVFSESIKFEKDYYLIYDVLEENACYHILLHRYNEGITLIYTDSVLEAKHHDEILNDIHKNLEEKSKEIPTYDKIFVRKAMHNKTVTNIPILKILSTINKVLDEMMKSNVIKYFRSSKPRKENDDKLYSYIVEERNETCNESIFITILNLKEGISIIDVDGTIYSKYDLKIYEKIYDALFFLTFKNLE